MYYTIKLHAGLGNQLFMIASIWGQSEKDEVEFILEPWSYGSWCHNHDKTYYPEIFEPFMNRKHKIEWKNTYRLEPYYESALKYENIPKQLQNTIFDGYFQSPKYFHHISNKILNWLLPTPLTTYKDINLENVCILHLRYGDYKDYPHLNVDLNMYFKNCLQHLKSDTRIIISTNDLPGVKIKYKDIFNFFDDVEILEETDIYTVIKIMASCGRGVICANSSFSWWGAYLNYIRAGTISFAPDPWFNGDKHCYKDIYFEGLNIIKNS